MDLDSRGLGPPGVLQDLGDAALRRAGEQPGRLGQQSWVYGCLYGLQDSSSTWLFRRDPAASGVASPGFNEGLSQQENCSDDRKRREPGNVDRVARIPLATLFPTFQHGYATPTLVPAASKPAAIGMRLDASSAWVSVIERGLLGGAERRPCLCRLDCRRGISLLQNRRCRSLAGTSDSLTIMFDLPVAARRIPGSPANPAGLGGSTRGV